MISNNVKEVMYRDTKKIPKRTSYEISTSTPCREANSLSNPAMPNNKPNPLVKLQTDLNIPELLAKPKYTSAMSFKSGQFTGQTSNMPCMPIFLRAKALPGIRLQHSDAAAEPIHFSHRLGMRDLPQRAQVPRARYGARDGRTINTEKSTDQKEMCHMFF